jgi:hypothetical protein
VVPHLAEPQEDVAGVRTRASAGDKRALDVEEDVHLEVSAIRCVAHLRGGTRASLAEC